jgi:hypothetical protein
MGNAGNREQNVREWRQNTKYSVPQSENLGNKRGTEWGTNTRNNVGNIYENGVRTPKKNVPYVVSLGNTIDFGEQDYHLASPVNLKLKGICLSVGLLICVDRCGFLLSLQLLKILLSVFSTKRNAPRLKTI